MKLRIKSREHPGVYELVLEDAVFGEVVVGELLFSSALTPGSRLDVVDRMNEMFRKAAEKKEV